jgi:hypothetical protein
LLGLALLASAVLLLVLGSGLTFFQDTWAFLMHRQGFSTDAFLEPHNEHIVLIPVAIEKLLIEFFGMTSALPERIVLTAMLLGTAALLFVYVRRRVGDWPALMAAVIVLFLGPAWQVLLWPFEYSLVGSMLTGIAMLLALERRDRRGDLEACVYLLVSIGFSSLGIAFAVGAAVDVLIRRRSGGWRRLWVPAAPLALYAAWYLAYGREAESALSLRNVLHSPVYLAEGVAAGVGAVSGLTALEGGEEGTPYLGAALLVVLVALLVWRLWRRPRIPARFWPLAASAASFWLLGGFNQIAGREPSASRYMHIAGIFVLMLAAGLLDGVRLGRRALLACAAATVAAVALNVGLLLDGADRFEEQTVLTRSDLAAMEIAERTIPPHFGLTPEIAGTPSLIDVNAAEYFPAVREHGSPAYSLEELAAAPEAGRAQADVVLALALPLRTATERGAFRPRGERGCVVVAPGRDVAVPPGETRIEVAPGPPASLALRRFAREEHRVRTEPAPGGSVTALEVPRDATSRPWQLRVEAEQLVRVCRPAGTPHASGARR